MKKRIKVVITFFFIITYSIFSQDIKPFEKVVDFDLTIKDLQNLNENNVVQFKGKFLILHGEIAEIHIINRKKSEYVAEVHLVTGEWINLDQINIHKCIVRFSGEEFYSKFPRNRRSRGSNEMIRVNDFILTVGKIAQIQEDSEGNKSIVITGYKIRKLK
jgi:hypothetical protein